MKKIITMTLLGFLFMFNFAKADVIPQGQKYVEVCQKIINMSDYSKYDFSVEGDYEKLTNDSCIQYYKFFGGELIAREKNGNVSKSDFKFYGNAEYYDEKNTLSKKEQYYKIKSIKRGTINLELVGGKIFYTDGKSEDMTKAEMDKIREDLKSKSIMDLLMKNENSIKNSIIIVGIILGAALTSFISIMIYRKINKK